MRTITRLRDLVSGLHVSVGRIVGASARVAARGVAAVAAIRDQIRASPAVHRDEAGWRENGVNGSGWTFATPEARCCVRGSREGSMIDTVLAEAFAGVVGCAFDAG